MRWRLPFTYSICRNISLYVACRRINVTLQAQAHTHTYHISMHVCTYVVCVFVCELAAVLFLFCRFDDKLDSSGKSRPFQCLKDITRLFVVKMQIGLRLTYACVCITPTQSFSALSSFIHLTYICALFNYYLRSAHFFNLLLHYF